MAVTLPEIAGLLTAFGGLCAGFLTWSTSQVAAQAKAYEGRVADLQKQIEAIREDADERFEDLQRDFDRQREDWSRQMTELRQSLALQAQTIQRQEMMIGDYARHVSKLERIMAGANLQIPDFEMTQARSNF